MKIWTNDTSATSKASKAKWWNFELLNESLVWYPKYDHWGGVVVSSVTNYSCHLRSAWVSPAHCGRSTQTSRWPAEMRRVELGNGALMRHFYSRVNLNVNFWWFANNKIQSPDNDVTTRKVIMSLTGGASLLTTDTQVPHWESVINNFEWYKNISTTCFIKFY